MIGLIASPAMEWSSKLPELGALLKEKLHVFDRPLALWQELQSMLGGPDTLSTLHMPKFDWVRRHWNSCRRPLPNSCCSSQR